MPIRLNLLAEAQTAEEMRRRDPVKRAAWIGGFIAFLVLLWAGLLQFDIMSANSELNTLEGRWKSMEKDFSHAVGIMTKPREIEDKLAALDQLATNRFLWGTVLNALQQVTLDNLPLVRFKGDQSYIQFEGTKPVTNAPGRITPGKPATSTEKIILSIDARDYSLPQGDGIFKFKEALEIFPFFQTNLQKKPNGVVLTRRDPPQTEALDPRPFVPFALECRFPEKTRQ